MSKIFHNRRIVFAQEYASHFLDHFDFRYLFISGDRNPRLSTQYVGEFYLYEVFLLMPGILYLFTKRKRETVTLIIWWLIAILPAATARETPHALRTASILPVGQIFSAAGLLFWLVRIARRNSFTPVFRFVVLLIVMFSFFYYLHFYYIHTGTRWSGEWQYGYKQMIQRVLARQKDYSSVVITRRLGRPYIYLLLYAKTDPRDFIANRRAVKDSYGFWEVSGYGKYYFDVGFQDIAPRPTLFIGIPGEIPEGARVLEQIYSPIGEKVFTIAEL